MYKCVLRIIELIFEEMITSNTLTSEYFALFVAIILNY